jgi:predicted amidohydrolase YtcJ
VAFELKAAIELLTDAGWGFRLHATYDETIRSDLDVLEAIKAGSGFPTGNRWFLDHAETVSARSLDRIASLGGAISVQNRMMFQGDAFEDRYGVTAASSAPPIGAMEARGLLVAAGTDGTRVSSYNPWLSLQWLVTGATLSGHALLADAHRVHRAVALELYTAAGAALTGESEKKARLVVGAFADFAVLTNDYFTFAADEISKIESLLTVVGGEIVHAAGPFEGMVDDLPFASVEWSPIKTYGGYTSSAGARQAAVVVDVALQSNDQRLWESQRKLGQPADIQFSEQAGKPC